MCKPGLMELGLWIDPSLRQWLFPPMLIMAPAPPHLDPWKAREEGLSQPYRSHHARAHPEFGLHQPALHSSCR